MHILSGRIGVGAVAVTAAVAATIAAGTPTAFATTYPTPPATQAWHFTAHPTPHSTKSPNAAADISCDIQQDSPHWSSGAGSVIGKVRVTCHGSVGVVNVYSYGSLSSVSGGVCSPNQQASGPPILRWKGYAPTQAVVSNGPTATFYLPPKGTATKLNFTATWQFHASVYVNDNYTGAATTGRYTGPSCP